MFSATATEASEQASLKWLRQAERIHVGSAAAGISHSIVQSIHVCAEHKKLQKLLKHLQQVKVYFPYLICDIYKSSIETRELSSTAAWQLQAH